MKLDEAMTLGEAMRARHAVRDYLDTPIEAGALKALKEEVAACNAEGALHIQLAAEEPQAFRGILAHYGKFRNVRNYIALVGKKGDDLDEKLGYYGERLVLLAQQLGLNTCWVAATYRKGKTAAKISLGESLRCVISLGYGVEQGKSHKNRPVEQVCKSEAEGEAPAWFSAGLEAAMLAPTARNQQSFLLTLLPDGTVKAEAAGGFFARMDLGIVKYHFEAGAGKENVTCA